MTKDFGSKIGGARKDVWKQRGLMLEDLEGMTEGEKTKYVIRDSIWPKPDMQKLLAEGLPRSIVYWQNEIRKTVHPTPRNNISHEDYITGVHKMRTMVESISDEAGIADFGKKAREGTFLKHTGYMLYDYADGFAGVFNGDKFLKLTTESGLSAMKRTMEKNNFGLSEEEIQERLYPIIQMDGSIFSVERGSYGNLYVVSSTRQGYMHYYPEKGISLDNCPIGTYLLLHRSRILFMSDKKESCIEMRADLYKESSEQAKFGKVRKKKWIPPQFAHLERQGEDFRCGMHVTGEKLIADFGIRGGEFGNWTSEAERQASLDMAYDAFADLAAALDIDPKDISLPGLNLGSLAIAFGARGRGDALAHYEPEREVINITRLKGAGTLGHEWAHALDDLIGKTFGNRNRFATDDWMLKGNDIPQAFRNVMCAILYTRDKKSQYYLESIKFGKYHTKAGHGYWESDCELFARAFACYILDRTKGKNDYLSGHSEAYKIVGDDGRKICAYPRGEERERINRYFDNLIADLKERRIFHDRKVQSIQGNYPEQPMLLQDVIASSAPMRFVAQKDGQLSFF